MKNIVITSGEPAGIGVDLCLMLTRFNLKMNFVVIGNLELFRQRANQLNIKANLIDYKYIHNIHYHDFESLKIIDIPLDSPVENGVINSKNANYVLKMLDTAIQGCVSGEFSAMVTCPIHKGVINESGLEFSGHTEYLAEKTNTNQVVMMLTSPNLRVALATTHLPLKDVPNAITFESLTKTIEIIHADLVEKFKIKNPKIYIAGLNPHAGENGYLGTEEIDTIIPVIKHLQNQGLNLIGPLPADTMFTQKYIENADCFLAMYHDQGLPVLKHNSFGMGINITLGLPIIRTSVDHGTAFDLVGTGNADCGSLISALNLAFELSNKI